MRASTGLNTMRTAQFSSRAAMFARPSAVSAGLKMRKAPVAAVEAKKSTSSTAQGVSQQVRIT
jgi:hypothetical protein